MDKPILFSGEMVRAILDGTKTQTRRVVKPQPTADSFYMGGFKWPFCGAAISITTVNDTLRNGRFDEKGMPYSQLCPYGLPGDRLWVRESWEITGGGCDPGDCNQVDDIDFRYIADGRKRSRSVPRPNKWGVWIGEQGLKVGRKPSIFMPRWASRITLEITEVRIERLKDISHEDARAEGVYAAPHRGPHNPPEEDGCHWNTGIEQCFGCAYRFLWNCINGPRGMQWDKNPWVWVVSFKRVDGKPRIHSGETISVLSEQSPPKEEETFFETGKQ